MKDTGTGTLYYAILWDKLYTGLGRFLGIGNDFVCTVGADIIKKNGGSNAYKILELARIEQNKRNRVCQTNLYQEGKRNFQGSIKISRG